MSDHEKVVLGSMMLAPTVIDEVAEIVTGRDFHQPKHEQVFDAIVSLHADSKPVDALSVSSAFGTVASLAYLHELTNTVSVASSAGYYAEKVLGDSMLRRVAAVGTRLQGLSATGADGADSALDVVNAARAELDALVTTEGEATPEDDLFAAIEDLEGDPGTPTPWHDLTEVLAGWKPGAFYICGARPGVGKSVIANAALLDMAMRGKRAVMFNLEMSKSEIYHRLMASVGEIDMGRIQHRKLNAADWERVNKAQAHLLKLPLEVDDRGSIRVAQIRAKVRTLQRRGDLGLVVIDYLQLMRAGGRVESRQQEVSEMSRALKLMAKELQVPVLALSQLNRGAAAGPERMPQMSDLRESGSLEQDADVVILLHRDQEREPDTLLMLVAKNRHGPNDRVIRLAWEGQYARATDQPNPYESRNIA